MLLDLLNLIHQRFYFKKKDDSDVQRQLDDALGDAENEIRNHNAENNIVIVTADQIPEGDCIKRNGIITSLNAETGLIDNQHAFKVANAAPNRQLSLHQTVSYLSHRNENGVMKVVKIEEIINERWDGAPTEEQIEEVRQQRPEVFKTHLVVKMGVVTQKRNGFVLVDADDGPIEVWLDEVEATFKPRIGDRVKLHVKVQTDRGCVTDVGASLKVQMMEPTVTKKITSGKVTFVEPNEYGIIDRKFIFYWDALDDDYRSVNQNDKVTADCIECDISRDNFQCSLRCLRLILVETSPSNKLKDCGQLTQLAKDSMNKNGIIVQDDIRVELDYNETKKFTMMVKNTSDTTHKVLRSIFKGRVGDSQLKLISPSRDASFFLKPNEEKSYQFEATQKFHGASTEHFYIKFGRFGDSNDDFIIHRMLEIVVADPKNLHPSIGTGSNQRRNYAYTQNVFTRDRRGFIPGVPVKKTPNFVAIRFQEYDVPKFLKETVLDSRATRTSVNETLDIGLPVLREQLCFSNYDKIFHNLLYLEECELFHAMRKYDRKKVFFTRDGEYLALKVENIAETRPSLVIGDSVDISNPWMPEQKIYKYHGVIHKVLHDRILIKFHHSFHDKYNHEDYDVIFQFSRMPLKKQHHAIEKAKRIFPPDLLFANKITIKDKQIDINLNADDGKLYLTDNYVAENHVPWFNESLNVVQKQAIVNILQGVARPMPYVIFGPPGTGKTLTIIETILQLVKRVSYSRIMVATPSNSSANLITERIIASGVLEQGEFIRLVGGNAVEKELIPENILKHCGTIDIARDGTTKDELSVTDSGLKMNCNWKYLSSRRILIGTCVTLGSLMQCEFPDHHFTHVIVDESGQCMETEIIIPLSFVDKEQGQIILAGDPMQLGPIVLSRFAAVRGLDTSFLVRTMKRVPYQSDERFKNRYDPRLITRLLYNYRSLPSIMSVYSGLFYNNDLIPMVSNDDSEESRILKKLAPRLPNTDAGRDVTEGVIFIGVEGKNEQCSDSPSWFNNSEAKAVFNFLVKLHKEGFDANDIGIITPYTQQVKAIRALISQADMRLPKIGTVEEFQGQERQIILLSTVRSVYRQLKNDDIHSLGFVKSSKRMNVAISRARALLVVFGSSKLLSRDDNWKGLIRNCVEKKCAVNVDPIILNMQMDEDEAND